MSVEVERRERRGSLPNTGAHAGHTRRQVIRFPGRFRRLAARFCFDGAVRAVSVAKDWFGSLQERDPGMNSLADGEAHFERLETGSVTRSRSSALAVKQETLRLPSLITLTALGNLETQCQGGSHGIAAAKC